MNGVIAHPDEVTMKAPTPFKAPEIISFLDTITQTLVPEY